jgi:hypothetical protein
VFFGHIGVGLAARRVAPKVSVGYLLAAAIALDVIIGVFLLLGVRGEPSMVWTHGLLVSVLWSLAVFALAWLAFRDLQAGAVLGALVLSHWVLDFISHPMGMGRRLPPDLPLLFAGSPKVGLGLYNSVAAALITELGLLAAGIVLYLRATRPKDRTGRWGFWLMIGFLAVFPALTALPPGLEWLPCLAEALLLPLGLWVDRHRELSVREMGHASISG